MRLDGIIFQDAVKAHFGLINKGNIRIAFKAYGIKFATCMTKEFVGNL